MGLRANDAQVEHVLKLLLSSLEAFWWESARSGVHRGTSGSDVVDHLMLH